MNGSALVRYDAACRAVAEAKSVDEVKAITDRAEGMRAYARQARNKQLEVDAAEIRLRAERRLGELIVLQKETVGLAPPGRPRKNGSDKEPISKPPTLADAGIDKKLSSRAQKFAAVPEQEFEGMLSDWRGRVEQENERVTVNLLNRGSVVQRYTGEDEWYTPAKYVEAVRRVLGGIDLDPATNDKANEVVQAAQIFTADDNGLEHDWHGSVFLNPPYKQPLVTQFVEKLVESYQAGAVDGAVLLTNNSTDTRWWQTAAGACSAACFTAGRIKFYRDREYDAPTNGQVFLYFGTDAESFAKEFAEFGFIAVPHG